MDELYGIFIISQFFKKGKNRVKQKYPNKQKKSHLNKFQKAKLNYSVEEYILTW